MGLCDFDPRKLKKRREFKAKYSDNPGRRLSDDFPDIGIAIDSILCSKPTTLNDICKIKIKKSFAKPKIRKKIEKAIKKLLKTKHI